MSEEERLERARPVDVGAIERELTQLWGQSGPEVVDDDPVTRACMSNLVIYCSDEETAERVPSEIGAIVQRHPSRVLLLVGHGMSAGSELEAYVSAVCYAASQGRQVCSEHVTLSAPSGGAARLPSVARPLLIGDLPTALWWASIEPPPSAGDFFEELASMSDHVIYDSEGWLDPVRSVVAVADWVTRADPDVIVSDLAWRRLKPWRRVIGQTLDPSLEPGALDGLREVVIEHGPHALPKAWLLIGWLACRLGWRASGGKVAPGVEVTWGFRSATGPVQVTVRRHADGPAVLRRVELGWQGASGRGRALFRTEEDRISVERPGRDAGPRTLARGETPRWTLVARQLPKLFRDPLFRETLEVSRTMAEALLR